MLAVLTLLIIVMLSGIVTRIATVALVHTGLSRESARFQARSAYSGVGFTTSESESIVGHPVRRRIMMWLMLCGNAGIVTVIASLVVTFLGLGADGISPFFSLLLLAGGLISLWFIASSKLIDRWMSHWISRALERWTDIDVRDYATLLHLGDDHRILEFAVKTHTWMCGRSLEELSLNDEGVIMIGLRHADSTYVGAPNGATRIEPGDRVILYGPGTTLEEFDTRRRDAQGENAHAAAVAVAEQDRLRQEQDAREQAKEASS